MSRVAKKPIVLPPGVSFALTGERISVKGPLGSLDFASNPAVTVEEEGGSLLCKPVAGAPQADALSGTVRAVVANMVTGVSSGFERKLNLVGVGYRAQAQGDMLNLSLGFSHPVAYKLPAGITAVTPTQTEIVIKGVDRQLVGQVAAEVRNYRKPEPYKGKGVRYAEEVVVIKETKKKK
ncbi:MAG: 50S ribosomal protein L6 [Accumulibacter sp.]|jgi:large subunit ribosomal protein L6|uniref:50S ribosomal protein L6 n=1 Tax=Accumulibacter sp. TaxID=2053492 RepID=UPI00121DF2BF|nr:50S ribosomal protein L6 [Accumulibacter sp.]QKS28528.1 MAG: 50S ribosomal protein L6 [Candidatus Accumulibacter similis]TLD47319.1 MAG: 50S ribosomal protein L6 [Accumulibacter sp.]